MLVTQVGLVVDFNISKALSWLGLVKFLDLHCRIFNISTPFKYKSFAILSFSVWLVENGRTAYSLLSGYIPYANHLNFVMGPNVG